MDADNLAVQRSDRIFHVWIQSLLGNSPEELAGKLASQHCFGTPATAKKLANGAFNVCYRVTFTNGQRVVVRFTALGRVITRNEKVDDEVAMMKFLGQHTTIPIPIVLGHSRCAIGPYIVMSYIEGTLLSQYLRDPSYKTDTLDPSISVSLLKKAYFGIVEMLLELSKPEFPYIRAIRTSRPATSSWTVHKYLLTLNINRLAQFSNVPHKIFKRERFSNVADYFKKLAQQNFYHLEHQRNNAVIDEADYRKKFIARCLFRRCLRQVASQHCNRPFCIYCDDLNPGNVLVGSSDLNITGVIDWEFAYVAPLEFSYAAPWWLVLERPEHWDLDLDQFLARFIPKFRLFLGVLQDCEAKKIKEGSLVQSQCLSGMMENSLETGLFWISLASRHSAMFDEIYWKFLDERFFGPFTTIEDRLGLLTMEEREKMGPFVEEKLRQASEGDLVAHYETSELMQL